MSAKIITWGEIINHKKQSISDNNKKFIKENKENKDNNENKENKENKENNQNNISKNNKPDKIVEENSCNNNSWQDDDDNSYFPASDFHGAGVGHTIVCQVSPSQDYFKMQP